MKKIVAYSVINGMVFEVKSQDSYYKFTTDKSERNENNNIYWVSHSINIPVGSKIVITKKPYFVFGSRVVHWKFEDGDNTEYKSHWNIFRNNTDIAEGVVIPERKPIKCISDGKYAGFNMEIADIDVYDFARVYGFAKVYIGFRFTGKIQGATKPNTILINQIKKSKDFKQDFLDMIFTVLEDTHREQVFDFINKFDIESVNNTQELENDFLSTYYNGGWLMYSISLASNDYETIKKYIIEHVDLFINSKKISSSYGSNLYLQKNA